jgi:hypothetical protein
LTTSSFGGAAINKNAAASSYIRVNSLSEAEIHELVTSLPAAARDTDKDVIVVVRNRCPGRVSPPRMPPAKHSAYVEDGKKYKVNNETGKVKEKTPATQAVVLTGNGNALVQSVYQSEKSGYYIYHEDGTKIEVTPKKN